MPVCLSACVCVSAFVSVYLHVCVCEYVCVEAESTEVASKTVSCNHKCFT